MVRIDPKKQFSKKLARWTAVFWFVFMTWLSVILVITPEAAQYAVYMAVICTAVMIINVISYSANSITEKRIFGMLDKAKIEVKLGPSKISFGSNNETESNDDETLTDSTEEGEDG